MLPRHLLTRGSLALAAGLLGGCGGGGGSSGPTLTLQSPATVDGYTTSIGELLLDSSNGIAVGDSVGNAVRRGFARFSLLGLPPGAAIVAAELRMAQTAITGSPYELGNVVVDHVDLGAALDATDHFAVALIAGYGVLSSDTVLTVKTLDVTPLVLADLAAGRPTSDYRLRFSLETDLDGLIDSAHFEDMENNEATGQLPVLVIQYR